MTVITYFISRAKNILGAGAILLATAACTQQNGFTFGGMGINSNAPVKVALLVPLESEQGQVNALGASLVNAARMARNDLAGVEMDLAVYPTAGDPAQASIAAQQAMANGAQVIIGPLFSTATASVAPIAAAKGVSVLSFSNNTDVAGNNVYLLGSTFDTIADRVVSYAVAQGRRDIGIVHSDDAGGLSGLRAANNAITRFGATSAGSISYNLSPTGISEAAPQIAEAVSSSGANAILFTDDPASGLTFLTPMLANEGLEAKSVQFLGLTRWNEPAAAAQTPSMQGGVFAAADPTLVARFAARYTEVYGAEPHALAGLAYDGVAAVGAMIAAAKQDGSKTALTNEQITDPTGFAGVNGIFRFKPDGTPDRGLALMQLRGGEAVMIDPSPRSFGAGL